MHMHTDVHNVAILRKQCVVATGQHAPDLKICIVVLSVAFWSYVIDVCLCVYFIGKLMNLEKERISYILMYTGFILKNSLW